MYRHANNDLKMVFMYNTNLKELKANLNIHPNYYFDFVTRDIMLERENKEMQYSGNLCCVYISMFIDVFLKYLMNNISDVIGLLSSISTLQKITIMKSSGNPRMKDIRKIEILLFG
jgi:hypothetical protein